MRQLAEHGELERFLSLYGIGVADASPVDVCWSHMPL